MQDLTGLKEMSARVGSNHLLVQGGGGNSSLKDATTMWVKASGYWLSDALTTPMFVPLDLQQARKAVKAGHSFEDAIRKDVQGSDLRPSIETGLHALMPHRVVLHAHPVNTITTSIVEQPLERLTEKLRGLSWAMLDYVQPGHDLSLAFMKLLEVQTYDVIVLRNHGLVIGAETTRRAEALLIEVEQRLALPENSIEFREMPECAPADGYAWLDDPILTSIAYQKERAMPLCYGALVPDQVVYLGGKACWIDAIDEVQSLTTQWLNTRGVSPGLIFVADKGALAREDLSKGGLSMISLLRDIAHGLPQETTISTLKPSDESKLLNWEAEAFRMTLDKDRA